jgi:SAM-dependent methyltransferase
MTARGYEMTGVERDSGAISSKEARVVEGSAEALPPLPDFDGVVFSHVVEHLLDPVAALRSAAKLLSPGGKLFIEVPNNDSDIARQSGLSWEHLDIPRHINFFGETSLRMLTKQAGLHVKRVYFSGYCRYFSDSYIATEQRIHDRLAGAGPSVRNSRLLAWKLLVRTARALPNKKYDSVGIVATLADKRRSSSSA